LNIANIAEKVKELCLRNLAVCQPPYGWALFFLHTQIIVFLPCAGLGFLYFDANIAWIMVFMTRNHSEVLKLILNTL